MCRSCQAAYQRVPGMYLSPPPQHWEYKSRGPHPVILHGFWGANSGSHACKMSTLHPLTKPWREVKSRWQNLFKSPIKSQATKQASTILTLLLFIISALAGRAFKEMWAFLHCLASPTSICFLNGFVFYLWKRTMFCLYLNSLQHKMNDQYTIYVSHCLC